MIICELQVDIVIYPLSSLASPLELLISVGNYGKFSKQRSGSSDVAAVASAAELSTFSVSDANIATAAAMPHRPSLSPSSSSSSSSLTSLGLRNDSQNRRSPEPSSPSLYEYNNPASFDSRGSTSDSNRSSRRNSRDDLSDVDTILIARIQTSTVFLLKKSREFLDADYYPREIIPRESVITVASSTSTEALASTLASTFRRDSATSVATADVNKGSTSIASLESPFTVSEASSSSPSSASSSSIVTEAYAQVDAEITLVGVSKALGVSAAASEAQTEAGLGAESVQDKAESVIVDDSSKPYVSLSKEGVVNAFDIASKDSLKAGSIEAFSNSTPPRKDSNADSADSSSTKRKSGQLTGTFQSRSFSFSSPSTGLIFYSLFLRILIQTNHKLVEFCSPAEIEY